MLPLPLNDRAEVAHDDLGRWARWEAKSGAMAEDLAARFRPPRRRSYWRDAAVVALSALALAWLSRGCGTASGPPPEAYTYSSSSVTTAVTAK